MTKLSRRLVRLLPHPLPPALPSPVSKWSLFLSLHVCRRSNLLTGEGEGRGGGGAKSYDGKKVCLLYIIQYSLHIIMKLEYNKGEDVLWGGYPTGKKKFKEGEEKRGRDPKRERKRIEEKKRGTEKGKESKKKRERREESKRERERREENKRGKGKGGERIKEGRERREETQRGKGKGGKRIKEGKKRR